MKHLERSIQLYAVQFSIFGTLSTHTPAFTYICGNALHYVAMGVCGSSEACMCNKGLNQAFGRKLFNFMLLNCGYFVLSHPTPLHLQEIVAMHSIKLAMGSVVEKMLTSAIRV